MSDDGDTQSQYTPEQKASDRRVLRVVVWVISIILVGLVQGVVNGVVLGDEADALNPSQRRSIESALQEINGCSSPLSRLVDLEPTEPGSSLTVGFRFRCALTILGVPVVSGEANCIEGMWSVPGFRGHNSGGYCGGEVGRQSRS